MGNRYLHALAIPEQTLQGPRGSQSMQIASEGKLQSDVPAVESISPDAGDIVVAGIVAGKHAELTATALEELFGAGGIEVVPFYGDESDPNRDGYYATTDISVKRATATQKELQRFDGSLTHRGSKRSHRRAVRTSPTSIDNPFRPPSSVEIGISSRADRVQWFDDRGGSNAVEDATVQRTVETEHDRVDIYEVTEPAFDNPALVYRLDYEHEWRVDARVWDTFDRGKTKTYTYGGSSVGDATIGEATIGESRTVLTWQRTYRTDHDFVGSPVLENGRIRLELDEDSGQIRAYRWNPSDGMYNLVQLGITSWRLHDADVTYIGLESVDAQLEFREMDGSGTHQLNVSLKRGLDGGLWANPDSEGSVPQGLADRLEPIAVNAGQDPGEVADIVERAEVESS